MEWTTIINAPTVTVAIFALIATLPMLWRIVKTKYKGNNDWEITLRK